MLFEFLVNRSVRSNDEYFEKPTLGTQPVAGERVLHRLDCMP